MIFRLLLLTAALALSGCRDTAIDAGNEKTIVTILGAKLIDGSGGAPVEDSVVVVEGDRIRAAGSRRTTPVPKLGTTVDGAGKIIIPGLVDTHSHYFGDRSEVERLLRSQISFGVTAARSTGVDTPATLEVLGGLPLGKISGPKIYTSGLGFTHPEGHPVAQQEINRPATPDQARAMVRNLAAVKADFVKIWVESKYGSLPKISRDVQFAIVDEASKTGLRVVAHIFEESDLRYLINLGVRDILHTVRDVEPNDALMNYVKSQNVCFSPTLSVIDANWYLGENPGELDDPQVSRSASEAVRAALTTKQTRDELLSNRNIPMLKNELQRAQRFVKAAADAGVCLAVGSDSGAGNVVTGWGTHHEMELMAAAGVAPMDILKAATSVGARLLSKDTPPVYGTIGVGQRADLVLLSADPLADIRNTRKIAKVMQSGQWISTAQ